MGEHDMPRTTEEFHNYVANELRAGDRRMDEIVNTVAQIQGHLLSQQYEGLIKKAKLRGGGKR